MSGKMFSYVNQTLHVTLNDGRHMTGTFIAYDKHMNLVLADVVETRPLSKKNIEPRKLGLVLLRGEHVVSVRAEKKTSTELAKDAPAGPGAAVPVQVSSIPVLPGKKK